MASYHCEKCGRVFELPDNDTTGVCPVCATPVAPASHPTDPVIAPSDRPAVYAQAQQLAQHAQTFGEWETAAKLFAGLADYQDAPQQAAACAEQADTARCEALYQQAKNRQGGTAERLYAKAELLRRIAGYRDADALAADYQRQADALAAQDVRTQKAQEQQQEQVRARERVHDRRTHRVVGWCVTAGVVLVALVVSVSLYVWPRVQYQKAAEDYENGDLLAAAERWGEIPSFADSTTRLQEVYYRLGCGAAAALDYYHAADYLERAGDYADAPAQHQEVCGALYNSAQIHLRAGDYADAQADFSAAGDYADAKAYKHYCRALRVWNEDDTVNADKLDVKKAAPILQQTLAGAWTNEQTGATVHFPANADDALTAEKERLQWAHDGATYEVRLLAPDRLSLLGDGALTGFYKKG